MKQVIFVRTDLKTFSKGAIAVQAVHAAVKAIEIYKTDTETQKYLADMDHMTTLLLKITEAGIKDITSFLDLKYAYVEWIEEPEHFMTAIALKPCYYTDDLDQFLRKYKLY